MAVISSILYLQLTPVMREVLTMSTREKGGKEERRRENKKQNDFREADVGNNCDNSTCKQRHVDLIKASKRNRETVKPRRVGGESNGGQRLGRTHRKLRKT